MRWCWKCRAPHDAQCPRVAVERAAQRDPVQRKALMRGKPRRCARCGKRKGLVVDHVVALRHGGTTQPHNLQWLCSGCHKIKTAADNAAITRE